MIIGAKLKGVWRYGTECAMVFVPTREIKNTPRQFGGEEIGEKKRYLAGNYPLKGLIGGLVVNVVWNGDRGTETL